jgi:hypothetical protein
MSSMNSQHHPTTWNRVRLPTLITLEFVLATPYNCVVSHDDFPISKATELNWYRRKIVENTSLHKSVNIKFANSGHGTAAQGNPDATSPRLDGQC